MKLSRQQLVGGLVGLVIIGLGVYAVILATQHSDPNKGLITSRPVEMDEATREYFTQRLATTKASIEAAESAGTEVDLNLYLSAASDAYSLGDLVTSREMLEKQLAGNSINYVAWNNYALVLTDMGDYEAAENAYKKTLEVEDEVEKYYIDYADFLRLHFPERRDDLKAVIEDDLAAGGQTVWNMTALAKWYVVDGACQTALDHYKVAVALSPKDQSLKDDMEAVKKTCKE